MNEMACNRNTRNIVNSLRVYNSATGPVQKRNEKRAHQEEETTTTEERRAPVFKVESTSLLRMNE